MNHASAPNTFVVHPANHTIWNQLEFLEFLVRHQKQSIVIHTMAEGVDLAQAGVYATLDQFEFQHVTIVTNNFLESHPEYSIQLVAPGYFLKIQHCNYNKWHYWNQRYRFGAFYNRPLWHRIGLAAELQIKYKESTLLNVRCDPHNIDSAELFEIQQLWNYAPQSIGTFSQAIEHWPCQIESTDTYTVGNTTTVHTDQLAHFYTDFLIDIVAETWIQGDCFYPTEKTIRPMLLKKPFIVMGPVNYLEYLRQMGFRTFGDFWDEEYDGYSTRDRYTRILKLIDQLSQMSMAQLETMYLDMQYTLDHNFDLLANQNYTATIKRIT